MKRTSVHLDGPAVEAIDELKRLGISTQAEAIRIALRFAADRAQTQGLDPFPKDDHSKGRPPSTNGTRDGGGGGSESDSGDDPGDLDRAPSVSQLRDMDLDEDAEVGGSGATQNGAAGSESGSNDQDRQGGDNVGFLDRPIFGGLLTEDVDDGDSNH